MSAPNFSLNHNTRDIYAFCLYQDYYKYDTEAGYEPTDEGYSAWSEYETETWEDVIIRKLTEKFGGNNTWKPTDRPRRDANLLAAVESYVDFAGESWPVSVNILQIPGRYDGWTVDFELRQVNGWDDIPEAYDLERDLRYCVNDGLARALAPKLLKRLKDELVRLTDQVDDVLRGCATHVLGCTALFSNGEAFYREVA